MNGNVYFVTQILLKMKFIFLLDCDFCSDLRYTLTENACILFENFENLILEDKFIFIMSNEEIHPFLAKTLYNMLYRRKHCLQ
jgi:hypothetical protein